MNRLPLTCITAGCLLLLACAPLGTAQTGPADPAGMVRELWPGLVRVEYFLQYDKADPPQGALGAERCPNCGSFHGNELRKYLEEDRPVETAGYLVAADRVMTIDPLIHPRFIKSISVRWNDQARPASIAGYARSQKAVQLVLEKPLAGARPLAFQKSGAPSFLATYQVEGGLWTATVSPFPQQASLNASGKPHLLTGLRGVALSGKGQPVSLLLSSWIARETPLLPPMEWPLLPASEISGHLDALNRETQEGLVRVSLRFRSPAAANDLQTRMRSRFGGDDLEEDGAGTQREALGVLLEENRVLVLANLKPKITARLEGIILRTAQGEIPAKFVASLKPVGAFVAAPEQPLRAGLKIYRGDLSELREQLLLRGDISVQGETRTAYFHPYRISTCRVGRRQQLYPELEEENSGTAFLFTLDRQLVALPLHARQPVSADRSASYRSEEVEVTPAVYVAGLVRALPEGADLSNVPASEADEHRLAWIGVELQPLNRELARANGLSDQTRDGETGALVTYVHPESPAAQAGIQPGAVLLRVKVPGQPLPLEVELEEDYQRARPFPWDRLDEIPDQVFERVPTPWPPVENAFIRALTDLGFGTRYTAEFIVQGKLEARDFEVVPGPNHYESAPRYEAAPIGLTVRDLTYDVRRYMQRKPEEPGVVVAKVQPGSKASIAGVKPYELITHVNEQPVASVKDFQAAISAGGDLKLSIRRMAKGRLVTISNPAQ